LALNVPSEDGGIGLVRYLEHGRIFQIQDLQHLLKQGDESPDVAGKNFIEKTPCLARSVGALPLADRLMVELQ
jgi:hypothetical protein